MAVPERRVTPRFRLQTPLSFHRLEASADSDHRARAINVSSRGVYFVTNLAMSVGEALEVLLEIPKRVTGVKSSVRRFTARVAHIESAHMSEGNSGVGVQLLYYERDLTGIKKVGVV